MKNINVYIIYAILLSITIAAFAEPPGGGYNGYRQFAALFDVDDENGDPVEGVDIKVLIQIFGTEGDNSTILYGTTNSQGWVNLSTTLDYFGYELGHSMIASLNDDRYTVTSSSNTSTTTSYNLYPGFDVVIDLDQNGIHDDWELPLAEKFCPSLTLHSGDQGVRPVPVEIMDRNGDGELGWQDVIVDVYDYSGNFVGYLSPCQIIIYPDTYYDQLYPYYDPIKNASVYVDSNNDGIYGGEGDFVEPGGMRLLYNHFEWGQIGETNPFDWYGHWQTKMAEFSGDSRYVNGTTYAHLFTDGSDIVIQYWFYYPFNACANRHEGEAEHIHVVVNSQNPSQAQINKVVYYYHHEKAVKDPAQITIVDQTHAKVYVGGYVSSWGMEGHGSHGSYWRTGVHENINPLGDDETVDGNGLVIDFDNYSNIVILPKFSYVNNGNNNINPYIDSYGNNLNFMIFNGLWGHILSTPSAGYKTYSFFHALVNGWPFLHFLKWFDLPEDVGNIAIAGFVQHVDWEEKGY